jgi:hypothetical protein
MLLYKIRPSEQKGETIAVAIIVLEITVSSLIKETIIKTENSLFHRV